MKVYVLTRQEGSKAQPVATTSNESDADAWADMSRSNDWYSFEHDQLAHLGIPHNGPEYAPEPVYEFSMPVPPVLDDGDPLGSLQQVSVYLQGLTSSMEYLRQAVRT